MVCSYICSNQVQVCLQYQSHVSYLQMKIIVTGGAGYIGSVTVRALLDLGHDLTVLDNLSHGNRDAVDPRAKFIEADVADFGTVVPDEHFDAVVHLAAFIAAGESMTRPEVYWRNNTVSSLQMLDALRDRNIKKLVFASTAAVYGNPVSVPITEESPTNPTNTYGMTKLAIDMALTSESIAHGLDATSLRFFNVAGAYKGHGERHPLETHIIPLLLEVVSGNRHSFSIYGNDYPTSDGTCIRDYIHVYDLARAIALSLEKNHPGEHHIYNLANGKGFSNKEVIAAVESVTGKKIPVSIDKRREGDPAILIASSEKAFKELGWKPQRPALEDMIQDAWQHYANKLNGKQ